MCGIVGYLGVQECKSVLLDGLKELEYRGYDSAGIAVLEGNKFSSFKAVGKLKNLEEKTADFTTVGRSAGIGHTRWATHGKPTEINAHPHLGDSSFVVHNGIIENYQALKKSLSAQGIKFLSQTDTEVIVHLFESHLHAKRAPAEAFVQTIRSLQGAFAVLLVTKSMPETIFFAKQGSPMIIGLNEKNEKFFGSSDAALIGKCNQVIYLEDGQLGFVTPQTIHIEDMQGRTLAPCFATLPESKLSAQKEGFRFFMEKEIYEQSQVIAESMMGRLAESTIIFDEIDPSLLEGIMEIKLCACGTSYHAALAAGYLFERLSKIRTSIEIASEFRYREPLLSKEILFIVISQSGETADTLETLKMAKAAGLKTLVICNIDNSSMVRIADTAILTRAGIEKGVASTKAFATQIAVLWMLSVYVGRERNTLDAGEAAEHIRQMREVPAVVKVTDDQHERIRRLSKRYLHGHGFFFIGRDLFYPLALEGALKLKEISYLHAEGYPSGEMKHGPIALADPELFTIALMPKNMLFEKTRSNIEELSARDATICAISSVPFEKADDFIPIAMHKHYMLEFFEMMVILQLLSLEIAIRLGNDVDMPRNLAKSVTVE